MFNIFKKWEIVDRHILTYEIHLPFFKHARDVERVFIIEEKNGKKRAIEVTENGRKKINYDWLMTQVERVEKAKEIRHKYYRGEWVK